MQHELVATNDGSKATFEITVEQKAVLSSVLQLRKSEGKVDPNISLGKAVIGSLNEISNMANDTKAYAITVLAESKDSSENLKALFDSNSPAKLRGVALTGSVCNYISEISKIFTGDWVIKSGNKVVKNFTFSNDPRDQAKQTVGTTLYQLVTERFKPVAEDNSLEVKARGTHLKAGDYADVEFYVLKLLTPTSGKAFRVSVRLNFVHWTYSGTIQSCTLTEDKIREKAMSEDLNYEIEDYDDYER